MNKYLDLSPEVAEALAAGKPVVALESTIISHGMPYPQNVQTALMVEQTIRETGPSLPQSRSSAAASRPGSPPLKESTLGRKAAPSPKPPAGTFPSWWHGERTAPPPSPPL